MENKNVELDITPENIAPESIVQKSNDEPNYKDMYIRSIADYDNMKKFMENKISNAKSIAKLEIISDIISPVYNDLRRGHKNKVDGCELILKNIKSALDKINIKVIDDDIIGSQFDTDFMDAVSAVKCSKNLDGTVESVVEPGFVDSVSKKTYVHAKVVVRKYI